MQKNEGQAANFMFQKIVDVICISFKKQLLFLHLFHLYELFILTLYNLGVCDDYTPHYIFDYHCYMNGSFWQKK